MSPYHLPVVDTGEIPSVALASMNEVHLEEVGLINRLGEMVVQAIDGEANPERISQVLAEWVEHTRAHFEDENRLMETYAFPPYPVHKAEHAKVLARIETLQDQWSKDQGLQQLADYIFVEWRAWFDQHVKSMDMVTAQFLSQVM
ncbi:MAG: hemerythrin family protein [Candidatus Thiodiazotropha sp.]